MQFFEALIAGGFIGLVLGYVGAGGAMLSVPILIYIFNFPPKAATVAALVIVFSAAFAGAIPKIRKRDVLLRDASIIWSLGLLTNIGGSVLAKHIPDKLITFGFALILVTAATSMLIRPLTQSQERHRPILLLIFISLVIGAMTGVFGVGGGFLAIPILVIFFNISHEKAAGTSLLIIALNCLTSFIAHKSQWHQISWRIPLTMSLVAVFTTHFASSNSHRVPVKKLRRAFAALLYCISIYTIFKSVH